MVKVQSTTGDVKRGKQGLAVYQGHYGQEVRRVLSPKSGIPSKPQLRQRLRFQQALAWRATLSREARIYLEGFAYAHGLVDDYGIALTWDKVALKIALEAPRLTILS